MTFCTNCGAENKAKHKYCVYCSAPLHDEKDMKEVSKKLKDTSLDYMPRIATDYSNLVRRNYLIWYLFSIVISLFAYIYLYINFMDLNELDRLTPNKEGPSLKTDLNNLILELVLCLFIPFYIVVVYHRKYKLLNDYFEYNQKKQKIIPIEARKRTGLFILVFVLLLISTACLTIGPVLMSIYYAPIFLAIFLPIGIVLALVCIGIGIYLIYCDYIWQKALNERILMINPNAEEKLLF